MEFNVDNNPFVCTTFVLSGYYLRAELWEIICLGIPYAILLSLWSLAWWNIVGFQFVVFYVICRYLQIRIKQLEVTSLEICRTRNFSQITPTLRKINMLFTEIDYYNDTYFSKFLLSFWLFFGSVIVLSLYQVGLLYHRCARGGRLTRCKDEE